MPNKKEFPLIKEIEEEENKELLRLETKLNEVMKEKGDIKLLLSEERLTHLCGFAEHHVYPRLAYQP